VLHHYIEYQFKDFALKILITMKGILLLVNFIVCFSQKIVTDYPTLPTLWDAETIEPGAPGNGNGKESYYFTDTPSVDSPSALWSNYSGCSRLIYITSNYDAYRYLLGCDAVDCCYETQDGNQVEFQIPNVHYSNPSKKVDVYYQRKNITNFGQVMEADEWSWSFGLNDKVGQKWRAYTTPCDDCVNGITLLQWASSAMGSEWFSIQFKNYKGYDSITNEGKNFMNTFQVPDVCNGNILECDDNVHNKYFTNYNKSPFVYGQNLQLDCGTCGSGYQTCCLGFAIDGYPCDCHLQEGGSGKAGADCGDCGTAYAACCIGYASDGYPCQCDVM